MFVFELANGLKLKIAYKMLRPPNVRLIYDSMCLAGFQMSSQCVFSEILRVFGRFCLLYCLILTFRLDVTGQLMPTIPTELHAMAPSCRVLVSGVY